MSVKTASKTKKPVKKTAKKLIMPRSINRLAHDFEFKVYHKENPEVYKTLKKLAMVLVKEGYTKIGIGLLWERMRWEMLVRTTNRDPDFQFNNNYRSCYARLLMKNEKRLADIFEIREKAY
jgi:hypothetical protein